MTQDEIIDIEIKDTTLSGRTKNALKAAGVFHVGVLVRFEACDLLRIPDMGRKSVEDVIEYLNQIGYSLKGQDKFYKQKKNLPWVSKLIEEAVLQERDDCSVRANIALLGADRSLQLRVLKAIRKGVE